MRTQTSIDSSFTVVKTRLQTLQKAQGEQAYSGIADCFVWVSYLSNKQRRISLMRYMYFQNIYNHFWWWRVRIYIRPLKKNYQLYRYFPEKSGAGGRLFIFIFICFLVNEGGPFFLLFFCSIIFERYYFYELSLIHPSLLCHE